MKKMLNREIIGKDKKWKWNLQETINSSISTIMPIFC